MHFFAVGYLNGPIPFLTWMVDAYTMDQAKYYIKALDSADFKKPTAMDVSKWATNNAFMQQLCSHDKDMHNKLKSAIGSYNNRIAQRLNFAAPSHRIRDDIGEVVDVVSAIPDFIKWLLRRQKSKVSPPFCIDLSFALKDVESTMTIQQSKSEWDDDDDDDDDGLGIPDDGGLPGLNEDVIGDIKLRLKAHHCGYYEGNLPHDLHRMEQKQDDDSLSPKSQGLTGATRYLTQFYKEFRNTLNEKQSKKDKNDHHSFDPETYPRNKRFGIFVDRRKPQKDDSDVIEHADSVTFHEVLYDPPSPINSDVSI